MQPFVQENAESNNTLQERILKKYKNHANKTLHGYHKTLGMSISFLMIGSLIHNIIDTDDVSFCSVFHKRFCFSGNSFALCI